MALISMGENRLGRGFIVLAPTQAGLVPFGHMAGDPSRHCRLLGESQRLRGRIYLKDGAITEDELTFDGRHIQPADDSSWHLLTVDRSDKVTACIRYLAHPAGTFYSDLEVSKAVSHQPSSFVSRVERAVQSEVAKANRLNMTYVELGGWVVGEELRCSTEAIRMVLMMYALSQTLGGAIALSTATTRHNSSSILRRAGGKSLSERGSEVPAYFDPHYNCEMEMVAFDSRFPNPRYAGWIGEFREALLQIPIIAPSEETVTSSLLHLHAAVMGPVAERVTDASLVA